MPLLLSDFFMLLHLIYVCRITQLCQEFYNNLKLIAANCVYVVLEYITLSMLLLSLPVPVVEGRVDNAIQRISIGKPNYAIRWIVLSTL